ncbi:phospholipase A2 inhibitor gamma subunit B-like isoform X2 [Hyla sarda]|uniref:phospholipase A2 inhibitor gamma subunit B-like isoform X2 n=1 Tax=Hyla sarda TaxID=327740 RepID=UPI0024C4028B|nr:phospholipase A2 inhibitor gamma subunit B-like isoform X2 [Hyla sarda]
MKLIGFLWVLSLFWGQGSSLSCTVCLAQNATFCTGNNVTCPPGRVCGSSRTVNMEDGIKKNEFSGRSCVPEDQCQGPGSFSTHNSQSKKGFSCCNTDNCTPPPPVLPPDNTTPNGLTCPTCTADGVDWCDTGRTMGCTGDETMCILQYSKMSGTLSRDSVLRGCATPTICNIGNQTLVTDGISVEVQISCTGGCGGLHCHYVLYILVGFIYVSYGIY